MTEKAPLSYRVARMLLPGLKRWIAVIMIGIFAIIYGVFYLLDFHPLYRILRLVQRLMFKASEALPETFFGFCVLALGIICVCWAVSKMTQSILGAYLPDGDREAIPDVLYKRRHLDRGPRIVVIGGGTGLSTLLKGIKNFTNNITAIVTVGDDGGSSGRLRQELGVLPPGDIRNCITALADEEKLVTELFRYRFEQGEGLEGHSFGNLFLTAICSITNGDMIEAVRVASRVLNSRGLVVPSTLESTTLVAEMEDGNVIRGESQIPHAEGRIKRLSCEPNCPQATPEAVHAIIHADLIILGPGSLYTSIIPNLLVQGIPEAIRQSKARKIYICNVMTQQGETQGYTASDHVKALLLHAGSASGGQKLVHAALVNIEELPERPEALNDVPIDKVTLDADALRQLGVVPVRRSVVSEGFYGHHDPQKLAKVIMHWYLRSRRNKSWLMVTNDHTPKGGGGTGGGGGGTGTGGGGPKGALERIASLF